MRLLSIVEATTITGPVKPLLMFSRLARAGVAGQPALAHTLLTTVRASRGGSNEFLSAARVAGLEVDVVPERFLFDPRVLVHMGRILRMRAPDIVETHDFKSHFLLYSLLRMRSVVGPRWVAFHHGYTRMSPRVRLYQQLDRLSLRRADAVVTLCQPFVEQLRARGVSRERITVISNAVEPREVPPASELTRLRTSLGLERPGRLIVSVGRLSPEKGHADLIRAFRELVSRGSFADCRLLLVGDGGERAALAAAASDLRERVIFAGHQADAWPYFCIADLFVLPSHTEGSPLVLLEAMAAGLPIVATTVGGVPEVVENGLSALLVAPRDIERMSDALAALLGDPRKAAALGAGAHAAAARCSPQAYALRLMEVYRGVCST
jgi:glycosyltransferase involved in cell wall biosynthesis